MKVVLTNLSDELYLSSRLRLCQSATKAGIETIYSYDFKDLIGTDFYTKNYEILKCPKGAGYWLWKSHIILESFTKISEGDIVMYMDAGIEIIDSLDPILDQFASESFVMMFGNANNINAHWTKRDCFVYMDCDSEQFWFAPHCDAAFILFKKCDESINFLKEWQSYGGNPKIITESPNTSGKKNLPGFIEHRWDQSILSLLACKYKIELYRVPTQFGNHYKMIKNRVSGEFNCLNQNDQKQLNYYASIPYLNSPYKQLLNHHRQKNDSHIKIARPLNKIIFLKNRIVQLIKKYINNTLSKLGYKIIKI